MVTNTQNETLTKPVIIEELQYRGPKWVDLNRRVLRGAGLDAAVKFEAGLNMERIDYLLERLHGINLMEAVGGVQHEAAA